MNNYMLVVDDLSINRDVLCNMFSGEYDMLQADTGEEAVRLAKEYEGKIALVLLDIQLPGISGIEILRMRSEKKILVNVPVIVITVADDPKIQLEAFRLGAMDYINKPFIREIVEYRVANASLRTAYKQLNEAAEEKEKALKKAEQANMAKSRFLTRISHELRTPMNAIIGLTKLLNEEPEDAAQLLDSLDISAHHLLGLLNEMMEISEKERGKTILKPEWVNITKLLHDIDNDALVAASYKGIHYHSQSIGNLDKSTYLVDAPKLKKVLRCLLDNALKFTPSGGEVVCRAENILLESGTNGIRFTVSDNGVGIHPDFLPHIFDEFETEFGENTTTFSGVGLGLSICKSTVGLLGGTIRAESTKGKGSTFIVEIPASTTQSEAETIQNQEQLYDFSGKTFLIVEDNAVNRKITVRLLERCRAETRTVENGQEAVEFFRHSAENSISAILMDIRMPVMDGLDAAKAIRALDRTDAKTVPIIAVTANAYEDDIRHSLDAGMNAHLSKPVEPEKMYATLSRFI